MPCCLHYKNINSINWYINTVLCKNFEPPLISFDFAQAVGPSHFLSALEHQVSGLSVGLSKVFFGCFFFRFSFVCDHVYRSVVVDC